MASFKLSSGIGMSLSIAQRHHDACAITPRGGERDERARCSVTGPAVVATLVTASLQNRIGNFEDSLRRPFGNGIPATPPRLKVSSRELDTRQVQGGAAKQRDSLSFNLAQVTRCSLVILFDAFRRVTEQDVRAF